MELGMSQLTIQLDENAERALQELQTFFGTSSKAAAIRTALNLANVIVPSANHNKVITIKDPQSNEDVRIAIVGS